MTVLALIPARGGSKGVPRKNLRRVDGVPLIERAIGSARRASLVDAVVVSTDSAEIASAARRAGADVIGRPPELATDTASSESVLLDALQTYEARSGAVDVLVFLQCTSPLIDPVDIDRAVTMLGDGYDSVFSAVPSHAFLWRQSGGSAEGVNHDWRVRERRQDRPAEFRETGAIYAMNASGFREHQHRFFGRVGICAVSDLHGIDIDSEADLMLAQFAAERDGNGGLAALDPARVRALVMDFDGVHTTNVALVDQDGRESVSVNRSDGLGLAALRATGLPMLILSTETNPVVAARASKLRIECLHGVDDKLEALRTWAAARGIAASELVYVGNDANDRACLDFAGWAVVVADAHPSVRYGGAMVTRNRGGLGALREIADRLLAGQGPYGWQVESEERS